MVHNLTQADVSARVRSVLYLDDMLTNKDPKFHTVAVHEADRARWASVEVDDGQGNRVFRIARFTPGVLQRAIDSADKNFDDFVGRDTVPFDQDVIANLKTEIAELKTQLAQKTTEAAELTNTVAGESTRIETKVQVIADDLQAANSNKGWFAGASWWQDVMQNHGASI